LILDNKLEFLPPSKTRDLVDLVGLSPPPNPWNPLLLLPLEKMPQSYLHKKLLIVAPTHNIVEVPVDVKDPLNN
jgi:hypothetical protein